jgi:hypothetical protein
MASKGAEHEAHVRGVAPAEVPDDNKDVDEHGLTVLKVSEGDMPDAEPLHKIAEANPAFDPNAALRGAMGVGPGLQDSEAKDPAVWVDQDSEAARKAGADAAVARAERELERVKNAAKAAKKGDPFTGEL